MIALHRKRPLYSACNEDTRSKITALEIGPDDTVVAIAAGGGRVLSLLTTGPRRMIAVDRRVDQLCTFELKAAAMAESPYDDFIAFLGLTPCDDRPSIYTQVRPGLSPAASRHWDRRIDLVRAGSLYAGRCETLLRRVSYALHRLGLFEWARPYAEVRDLDEQLALLLRDRDRFQRGFRWWRLCMHPLLVFAATQDPGFLRSTEGPVGGYLYRRLLDYGQHNLFRESFVLHLIYYGCYTPTGPLPLYLTPAGFRFAKKHLDRVATHCTPIQELSECVHLAGRIRWSLSDISAWMSGPAFQQLIGKLVKEGDSGSRLCWRNFAARRRLPANLHRPPGPLRALRKQLDRSDSSVFWSFEVTEVS